MAVAKTPSSTSRTKTVIRAADAAPAKTSAAKSAAKTAKPAQEPAGAAPAPKAPKPKSDKPKSDKPKAGEPKAASPAPAASAAPARINGGPDYQIAALWIGGPLSFLEQLCLVSFVHAGHHTVLYTYETVPNVPSGVDIRDANEILPQKGFLKHERTGSPALHSDLFRYHMLAKLDRTIWADTDAYCVKPFTTPNGHFYGWESKKHINGGVLGLPPDSETLRRLLDFTSDPFSIPSYYGPDYQRELEEKRAAGTPVHASEQPWGVWGPHAITHFLHETGEVRFALPRVALYPIAYKDRRLILRPGWDETEMVTDDSFSIHFYGRRMRRRIVSHEGGIPRPRSLFGRLLKKHGIDPTLAPIPLKPGDPGFAPDDDSED